LESVKGRDGRLILEWILAGLEVADWVLLAQDGDRWQAVVNTVINVLVL